MKGHKIITLAEAFEYKKYRSHVTSEIKPTDVTFKLVDVATYEIKGVEKAEAPHGVVRCYQVCYQENPEHNVKTLHLSI